MVDTAHTNGSTNGNGNPTLNQEQREHQLRMADRKLKYTELLLNGREKFWDRLLGRGNGDLEELLVEQCGMPAESDLSAQLYRTIYDKFSIANRAVKLMPMECWQKTPEVYESE